MYLLSQEEQSQGVIMEEAASEVELCAVWKQAVDVRPLERV